MYPILSGGCSTSGSTPARSPQRALGQEPKIGAPSVVNDHSSCGSVEWIRGSKSPPRGLQSVSLDVGLGPEPTFVTRSAGPVIWTADPGPTRGISQGTDATLERTEPYRNQGLRTANSSTEASQARQSGLESFASSQAR